jgi:hypothetical protein
MSVDGPLRIGLVGEDEAHYTLMSSLSDEVILDHTRKQGSPWPEREELDQARTFSGPIPGMERFYKRRGDFWKELNRVAGRPVQRILRVGDQPAGEASYFIELYRFFALHSPGVQALVVLRDTDGYFERGEPAIQLALKWVTAQLARSKEEEQPCMEAVVFGAAHQDAEAWFLPGLKDAAPERLAQAKQELSLDPLARPEALSNEKRGSRPERDPKRVLRFLLGEGENIATNPSSPIPAEELPELAERCLRELDRLASGPEGTGLPAFIQRLREHLAPRILGY